jgi:GDPmannose 4,6-dehydratase
MWRMLQHERPEDYVLASGRAASIEAVVALAFAHVGLDWREHVRVDDAFKRPAEAEPQVGDASKARRELGWEATTGLEAIIGHMVDADLERLATVGRP